MIKALREWNKKRLHARRRGRYWATYHDWLRQQSQRHASVTPCADTILILVDVSTCKLQDLSLTCDALSAQIQTNWQVRFIDRSAKKGKAATAVQQAALKLGSKAAVYGRDGAQPLSQDIRTLGIKWICLLEAGAALAPQTLASVLHEASHHDHLRLIYGDHDHIDNRHIRFAPHFKPDLNPEMLLSWNYIGNTFFVQADRIKLDYLFDDHDVNAQRWRILLDVTYGAIATDVLHIPDMLHHVRHGSSTTRAAHDESHLGASQISAGMSQVLHEHLQQHLPGSTLSELPDKMGFRVHFAIPTSEPFVSIIIPTRNAKSLVEQCICSLLKVTDYPHYEVVLIDNGSDDPEALESFNALAKDPRVRVIRDDRPFNYSALNNAAVTRAKGELILLLNNDTEFKQSEWLREMVSLAIRPEIGCVGAKLLYPNGSIQHVGVITGIGGVAGHAFVGMPGDVKGYFNRAQLLHSVSVVTAACLLVKRSVFEQVGGLNETALAVAYNDVDFCLRVRDAGYRNVLTPFAVAFHHESATRGSDFDRIHIDRFRRERAYMLGVWGSTLEHDPAYNVNLTLKGCNFEISPNPRSFKHV